MSAQLLIVYHSQSGACARLARSAASGAQQELAVETRLLRAWDADVSDLLACDGLLLVAAENSATLAGTMKDFLDRTFYPSQGAVAAKPVALLVSAGNDGRGAVAQVERIARGYPLKWMAEPQVLRGEVTAEQIRVAEEAGQALATGLAMGIF